MGKKGAIGTKIREHDSQTKKLHFENA